MTAATLRAADWSRIALLALAGGAWCTSFAPLSLPWLQCASLATVYWVVSAFNQAGGAFAAFKRGALLGWIYGFFMFGVGVSWLFISLHEFGEVPAVIAVLAVIALAAYMALFPAMAMGIAGFAAFRVKEIPPPDSVAPVSWVKAGFWQSTMAVVAAAAWALCEWLRAVVFTGFPWLNTGEAWIDTPLAGFYPVAGSFGVAFLLALSAQVLAQAFVALRCERASADEAGGSATQGVLRRPGAAGFVSFAALVLAFYIGGTQLSPLSWNTRPVATVRVHLVQPDVSQTIKFDPDHITRNFLDTVLLGRRAAEASRPGDWLMFPETALPVLWQEAPAVWRDAFAELAWEYQTPVVMGAAMSDGNDVYTNSVIALLPDAMKAPEQPGLRYDKRHLVPFGEFIPPGFRWFVDLMNMPLGDFNRGKGAPAPFQLGALRVLPNVCYEDVFSHEMAALVRTSLHEPDVLFNVSNLAWFGGSWALEQHGQMSRVRAAELRKPMVRATNTGISGVIDAQGQWVLRMPDNERAVAWADVTGVSGLTPFARWGLTLTVGFVAGVAFVFVLSAMLLAFAWSRLSAFAARRSADVQ